MERSISDEEMFGDKCILKGFTPLRKFSLTRRRAELMIAVSAEILSLIC